MGVADEVCCHDDMPPPFILPHPFNRSLLLIVRRNKRKRKTIKDQVCSGRGCGLCYCILLYRGVDALVAMVTDQGGCSVSFPTPT